MIRDAAQRDVVQPAARIGGNSLRGPLHRRGDECFLHCIFGVAEIVVTPCNRAQHLRRKVAQQALDRIVVTVGHASMSGAPMTWRTSTGMMSGLPPGPGAADAFAAI